MGKSEVLVSQCTSSTVFELSSSLCDYLGKAIQRLDWSVTSCLNQVSGVRLYDIDHRDLAGLTWAKSGRQVTGVVSIFIERLSRRGGLRSLQRFYFFNRSISQPKVPCSTEYSVTRAVNRAPNRRIICGEWH